MRASHFRLELHLVERRRNPLHPRHCVLAKGNTGLVSAHQHGLNVGRAAQYPEQCHREEVSGRVGQHSAWQQSEAELDFGRVMSISSINPLIH